jgi:hypothetical protein
MRVILTALATVFAVLGTPAAPAPARIHFRNPEAVRREALADVERRLRRAEVPPGSRRLKTPPKVPWLLGPGVGPITPNVLERRSFWSVPGTPAAAIAWVRSHPPDRQPVAFEIGGSKPGDSPTVIELIYEWPATKVAGSRQLGFTVGRTADGSTILKVDSQAAWVKPHPRSAVIPPSARSLEVELERSRGRVSGKTITELPEIRRISGAIARLPASQPGPVECGPGLPEDFERVDLFFRNAAGDTVAEGKQRVYGSWCGSLFLTVEGRRQPVLEADLSTLEAIPSLLP